MAQNQQLTGFIIREIDLAHLVANGENLAVNPVNISETPAALKRLMKSTKTQDRGSVQHP